MENRRRFLLEVLRAVRAATSGVVGLRVSLDERDEQGLDVNEALAVIGLCSDEGLIDYVSVTTGTSATLTGSDHIAPDMAFEAGYVAQESRRVRSVTSLPVLLAGRFNQPQEAERFLADRSADAIAMTRALICDPEMPRRALAGELDDIRACVGCNQACIGHFQMGWLFRASSTPKPGGSCFFRASAGCLRRGGRSFWAVDPLVSKQRRYWPRTACTSTSLRPRRGLEGRCIWPVYCRVARSSLG